MTDYTSTVRSREFGETLRRIMVRAGFMGKDIARLLGISEAELSRMLAGRRQMKDTLIASFLAHCKVSPQERDRILELANEARKPGWWQQHGDRLPERLQTLIDHEDNALRIVNYQATVFPGLLHTAEYARALILRSATLPREEIESRVAARLERAKVFGRKREATYNFFFNESVLRLPVGGREVMSDQLHHLLRLSVRPYLNLRVLPTAFGAHAAVTGSFTLMDFAAIDPVAYVDTETSALFLERPEEIGAYRKIVSALVHSALDASQSTDLIRDLAVELYGGQEDDDGYP